MAFLGVNAQGCDRPVTRLYLDAPLNPANRETFYCGADQGYTDYPMCGRQRRTPVMAMPSASGDDIRGRRLPSVTPQNAQQR